MKIKHITEGQVNEISANPDYLRAAERSLSQARATQRTFGKSPEEKARAERTIKNRERGMMGYSKRHRAANPEMYPKVKAQPAPKLRDPSTEYSDDYSVWAKGRRDTMEQGLAEGSDGAVSFREMIDVVDQHYPKYYAELSGSDISDKQFERAIVNAYKEIIKKQGVAEGQTPEQEIERLKLRQNAEHGGASLKRQAATQARIRELEAKKKQQGVAESIPYALSAANAAAEYRRQGQAGGGYRGRIDIPVGSREDYIASGKALKKAAAAAGQHIEYGLSDGVMSVFSDSMTSDELDSFIDDTLENFDQGVAEGDISQLEKDIADAPVEPIANMEGKDEKIGGRHDPDDFDAMVGRLKKLAGSGPMKTVYDPNTRRYKNMPTAVQPPVQPKK